MKEILEQIRVLIEQKQAEKTWVAGKDFVNYAGPYFNADEYVAAAEALLNGWLVMGNSTTFNISGTLSAYGTSPVGQYAQFAIGSGNTSTGASGAYLNALGTTVTYPFIVVDLITFPPGANGADPESAYNKVVVGFNTQIMRTNGAGPTGIS